MNGIKPLLDHLQKDTDAKLQALHAETAAQVEDLEKDYARRAQELENTLLAQGEEQLRLEHQRQLRLAHLSGRNRLLSAKQALLSATFQRALEQLTALPREAYTQLLIDLCVQAAGEGGSWSVLLSPRDRESLGSAVVEGANARLAQRSRRESKAPTAQSLDAPPLTLSPESRPIVSGVILHADGVELNGSFDALLALHRESLEAQLAQRLFAPV